MPRRIGACRTRLDCEYPHISVKWVKITNSHLTRVNLIDTLGAKLSRSVRRPHEGLGWVRSTRSVAL